MYQFNLSIMIWQIIVLTLICTEVTFQLHVTILHTNDVHARFEEFDRGNVKCDRSENKPIKCYGGVARRGTKVQQIRNEVGGDKVLFLDGGDQFQGTLWFYVYEGHAASFFMKKLGYDVMALGNHEFDLGPDVLGTFLDDLTFDVVSANIDTSREPAIDGKFSKSTVKTIDGERIGIVGYLYERTPEISQTRHVQFLNEIDEVQREVDRLIGQGINKIIALGHSGIRKDIEIANKVRGVDIVVGGHSDTFLYTGTPPSTEEPYSNYPIEVNPKHDPSAKVLVVQDYTFGKYLGRLNVIFDDEGRIESYSGNPILLDESVEQDPELWQVVKDMKAKVSNFSDEVIAKNHVKLDGSKPSCRLKECNLGNLIADAYLWSLVTFPDEEGWNEVSIAIQNGGGIRTSILKGDITVGDVSAVLPFGNTVDYMELQGRYVKEMLEVGVEEYDPVVLPGKLLQTSGLLVTYDIAREPMDRVVEVLVRCSECEVPDYEPLDYDKFYKIVMHSFLAKGGDGFFVIKQHGRNHFTGSLDTAVLSQYLKHQSPIITGVERRITILNGTSAVKYAKCSGSSLVPYMFITIVSVASTISTVWYN